MCPQFKNSTPPLLVIEWYPALKRGDDHFSKGYDTLFQLSPLMRRVLLSHGVAVLYLTLSAVTVAF